MFGESPDVFAMRRHGTIPESIIIECKANRSDFLKDKKKVFRQYADMGMGVLRYYFCCDRVITKEDLPENWGLLVFNPTTNKVKIIVDAVANDRKQTAFNDTRMLYSLLSRAAVRGLIAELEKPYISIQSSPAGAPA